MNPTKPTPTAAQAVVIGASAGAIEALSRVLPALPSNYPLPIMAVVHLPAERKSALAECFRHKCQITVREADDKEPISPGVIYFAPPDYHLLVEANHRLSLSNEEPIYYSRPSIDVLFESAAEVYESSLIGIILTGANHDGSHGLKTIRQAGGMTVVQDPDTALAREMPQAALKACPDSQIMTLSEIAEFLGEVVLLK